MEPGKAALVMFLQESVQRCAVCAELTPHSRRVVALPKCFACLLSVCSVWCFLQAAQGLMLATGCLLAALILLLRERDSYWKLACERCRTKQRATLRRTKPTLDGRTEICPF